MEWGKVGALTASSFPAAGERRAMSSIGFDMMEGLFGVMKGRSRSWNLIAVWGTSSLKSLSSHPGGRPWRSTDELLQGGTRCLVLVIINCITT